MWPLALIAILFSQGVETANVAQADAFKDKAQVVSFHQSEVNHVDAVIAANR